jgi:hypothetical protein
VPIRKNFPQDFTQWLAIACVVLKVNCTIRGQRANWKSIGEITAIKLKTSLESGAAKGASY